MTVPTAKNIFRVLTDSTHMISGPRAQKFSSKQICSQRTEEEFFNRRTKMVCTLGPACWEEDRLVDLIEAGMSIARFNFSHGDHVTHERTVNRLKNAMKRTGRNVGILLDTKGPEIRTGFFKPENDGAVQLVAGQILKLHTDYSYLGDSEGFACSYDKLCSSVKVGGKVLIADGSLVLSVVKINDDHIDCKVLNDATLGERKNMNLPGVKVQLPVCGPKELEDIQQWGLVHGAHYCAASFVQSAEDVHQIRDAWGKNSRVQVVSKIENLEGILNFDDILEASDCIMVARGDMGMEIPPEKVFLAQKMMIAKCNLAGKPVITATQMLESMIENPRPTRAEASDVSNAVLDGTDAVMLSGESANGKFPAESVKTMARCCLEAESALDYEELCASLRQSLCVPAGRRPIDESLCCSAVSASNDVAAKLIIVLTESGRSARFLAKYRPQALILAVTSDAVSEGILGITRGVDTLLVKRSEATEEGAIVFARQKGYLVEGDVIVFVNGTTAGISGSTNSMRILTV